MADYPAPVNKLLTLGDLPWRKPWLNYVKDHGLTSEHVPDLIRMVRDPELNRGDSDGPEIWAPLHAWRSLGQLRAVEAVPDLLLAVEEDIANEGDYAEGEMPDVFEVMGPPAILALMAWLSDKSHDEPSRALAGTSLAKIATKYPESRPSCVAALSALLEDPTKNSPFINGSVVGELLALQAVESAALIERAYAAGVVDEVLACTWEHAQWELGPRTGPKPRFMPANFPFPWDDELTDPADTDLPPEEVPPSLPAPSKPRPNLKERAKARRKQAAKSRKQNRKRR